MSKPIFFGRLDFLEFMMAVSELDSDVSRSDWLKSFARSLAKNERGINALADSILDEALLSRDIEAKRKADFRFKMSHGLPRMSQDVPRTTTDVPRCPTAVRYSISNSNSISNKNTNTDPAPKQIVKQKRERQNTKLSIKDNGDARA